MDAPQAQKPTVMEQVDKIVALLTQALDVGGQLVGTLPAEAKDAVDPGGSVLNAIDAALEDALHKAIAIVGYLGRLAERLG